MAILSIFTFLLGLGSFFYHKRHLTLICLVLLSYNYFNLTAPFFTIGFLTFQNSDLGLLLILLILPFRSKMDKRELSLVKNSLVCFLLFLTFAIFYDFIYQGTSAAQIFRCVRLTGYLFFFFLIKSFSFHNYHRLLNFLVYWTVLHSLMYISQYIFNYSFFSNASIETDFDGLRFSNSPPFITIVLILVLVKKNKDFLVYFQILAVLLATLLTLSRGAIISALVVVLLYLILQYQKRIYKSIVPLFILLTVATSTLAFSPVLKLRFGSMTEQISGLGEMDFDNLIDFYHQGSLTFRLGLTFERLLYVLDDTKRMIIGVGFVPDIDIENNIFIIGTKSDLLPSGYEQYNSGDILYPNIITRYGILGSLIFLFFLYSIFLFFKSNIHCYYGKISFIYLISSFILTFNNQSFYQSHVFLIYFILTGLILSRIVSYKQLRVSEREL